ncbi:MAG: signal peptidase I [Verrucomicrobiales bacterium]
MTAINCEPLCAPRKPTVALNLSLLSPGLGHVYCGVIARGLLILAMSLLALAAFIVGLVLPFPGNTALAWIAGFSVIALGVYGCIDSRKLALGTRRDYRLKDYNRPLVYALLAIISGLSVPVVAIVLKTWVVEAFIVVGDSSYPTYDDHARVLANKRAYDQAEPQPGDSIVFTSPTGHHRTWIKRVIAVAGDEVEIINDEVYVNCEKLPRDVIGQDSMKPGVLCRESVGGASYQVLVSAEPAGEAMQKITVPVNHVYVLGDNRTDSQDSRHFGPISIFSIKGKVTTQYWPLW